MMKMKTLGVILSLVVFTLVLYGCPAPQPPGSGTEPTPTPTPTTSFTLNASTLQSTYNIGESVIVSVLSSKPCYLSMFNIDTQGVVTQIFPNNLAMNNYMEGGQMYHLPSQTDRFRLRVTGPAGTERIRVIATLQNVGIVVPRDFTNADFPVFKGSVEEFDRLIDQQLGSLPESDWTQTNITFQVQ